LAHADVGWENADTSGQITDAGEDRDASGGGIARELGYQMMVRGLIEPMAPLTDQGRRAAASTLDKGHQSKIARDPPGNGKVTGNTLSLSFV
jgi:hypothetical protein